MLLIIKAGGAQIRLEDDINFTCLHDVISTQCREEDIKSITIQDAQLGNEGAEFLAAVIRNNKAVDQLIIRSKHNFFADTDYRITDLGMKHLAFALKANKQVETVEISANNIGYLGAKHIADSIAETGIKRLTLDFNELDADAMQEIARALQQKPDLEALSIAGNVMSRDTVPIIADAIAQHTRISCINLASCNIDPNGAQSIARSLASHPSLRTVNLQKNRVGPVSLVELVLAIGRSEVEYLNVMDNNVGAGKSTTTLGLIAFRIAESIKANNTIRSINLAGNSFDTVAQETLMQDTRGVPVLHDNRSTVVTTMPLLLSAPRVAQDSSASSSSHSNANAFAKAADRKPLRM